MDYSDLEKRICALETKLKKVIEFKQELVDISRNTIKDIVDEISENAENTKEILNNFDKESRLYKAEILAEVFEMVEKMIDRTKPGERQNICK